MNKRKKDIFYTILTQNIFYNKIIIFIIETKINIFNKNLNKFWSKYKIKNKKLLNLKN
jgi:hypothetical protein